MARIAILGWGSLYWDRNPTFDRHHRGWRGGPGPAIRLEYSQIVGEKDDGLSLVIDPENGAKCPVGHAISTRDRLADVVNDLMRRETTDRTNIGFVSIPTGLAHGHDIDTLLETQAWAVAQRVHGVVWTDTPTNFKQRTGLTFSVTAALRHIRALDAKTKARVAEYVWRSPSFVDTPLRRALQRAPWF